MSDPYYNPEDFGLELYGEVDIYERNYDYHIFAIWRVKDTGEFAWSYDSGCSCSTPFEAISRANLEYGTSLEATEALSRCIEEETYSDEAAYDARFRSLDLVSKLVFA